MKTLARFALTLGCIALTNIAIEPAALLDIFSFPSSHLAQETCHEYRCRFCGRVCRVKFAAETRDAVASLYPTAAEARITCAILDAAAKAWRRYFSGSTTRRSDVIPVRKKAPVPS